MVASSRVIIVTNSREGVGSSSTTGIAEMLLAHDTITTSTKTPPSIIRGNSLSKLHLHLDHQNQPTVSKVNVPRRRTQAEIQRTFLPSNSSSNSLRRVRSDNLAQSKRDDPSVRRSIFGQYLKQKPRSYSAQHFEPKQSAPPNPSIQFHSPRLPHFTKQKHADQLHDTASHHRQSHDHPSRQFTPVDYRVFAPSEKEVAESAICCRYRKMNQGHHMDLDYLLERQVLVERSLPPFPSPLMRFCSDTTVTAAGTDFYPRGGSVNYFSSSDGEMHYHGVYSLLTPTSILRPSRYTNKIKAIANETSASNSNDTSRYEIEELDHDLSVPISSSFNFPRSYIENSAILKNFSGASKDPFSATSMSGEGEEEKNENEFITARSTLDVILLANKAAHCGSSSITTTTTDTTGVADGNNCCENDSRGKPENPEGLLRNHHLRFDPRVTVTEFEDPIPRKWYDDGELDQHKREATLLAQSYLRKHPVVADWYRRAILDPITKTYRKRALYSLPVFSSTYSSSGTDQTTCSSSITNQNPEAKPLHNQSSVCSAATSRKEEQLGPLVKKILVVHPNPNIANLFCKSMKSMFPSSKLVTTGSSEVASRLINQSFVSNRSTSSSPTNSASFDIIIVEQRLTCQSDGNNKLKPLSKIFGNWPLGFLETCMKKNQEESSSSTAIVTPSMGCSDCCGSDLIHQVCKLTSRDRQRRCSSIPPSLLIGVSVRPELDAGVLRRAGADIVWGIPIPSVGATLRNKLLTRLHAKRSSTSSNPTDGTI